MRNKTLALAFVALLPAVAGLAAQDAESRISARDVFRDAKDMFYVQNKGKTTRPARPRPAPRPTAAATPAPPRPTAPRPEPPVEVADNPPPPAPTPTPAPAPTPSNEPQLMTAALTDQPLGLRYSLLRKTESGDVVEVDSASEFKSGDSIRLAVESSDIAYLYVVNKGSSGRWNVLFPSRGIAGGANRVEPDYRYVIPPGGWFTFDEQVGKEQLFILLSRTPVTDLENVIYDMGAPEGGAPAPEKNAPKVLLAKAAPLDDSVIQGYRRILTRDLLFEKVDDTAAPASNALPGVKPEKAVYVVTKSGGADARVVADLDLVHR